MFISKLKVFHFDKIFTLLKISCNIFKSISLIYLFIFFFARKTINIRSIIYNFTRIIILIKIKIVYQWTSCEYHLIIKIKIFFGTLVKNIRILFSIFQKYIHIMRSQKSFSSWFFYCFVNNYFFHIFINSSTPILKLHSLLLSDLLFFFFFLLPLSISLRYRLPFV